MQTTVGTVTRQLQRRLFTARVQMVCVCVCVCVCLVGVRVCIVMCVWCVYV
jgi:hypothetical protein